MIWAALTISAVVAVSSIIGAVFIAVKLSQRSAEQANVFTVAHESTLASLERIHEKNMNHFQTMADRFMALDFTQFKTWQSVGETSEGGFEEPDEPTRVERPLRDGRYAVVGADREMTIQERMAEAALLKEDFPPGWDET